MNYIKRLEQENEELKKQLAEIEDKIIELKIYMSSDKFKSGNELDGYVNIADVWHRIT